MQPASNNQHRLSYFTTVIILSTLLFSALNVSAQRFKGGALVGLNASQIDGDAHGGFYKMGLLLGAFVNTDFNEKFGGQMEIKFSGKGAYSHPDNPDIDKFRLNYIDVPFLITYQAIENLKAQVGVSINYLYKAEYYEGDWLDNWAYEPNKYETALTFGVNYSFFQNFDLNARYSYSLFPIRAKYSQAHWEDKGAWYNNVISFALYFNFGHREN